MSAPITEAHRKLRETLEIRWMRATELEIEQLISDSEARAVASITAERDQLRAEVERLKKQIKDDNRSYGCELRDPYGTIWQQATNDHARAERAEAELKDRAAMMRDVMRERDAAEISLTAERAIVSRIWVQLGSPTYEQLKGRSIYDLIDEMKAELAAERARLSELKAKGCEALIIATTWAHVWGDKLSPDSLRDFKKHEAAFLADAAMKEGAK